jgi:hypothetical protein
MSDLLRRYHSALSPQNLAADLDLVTRRFVINHNIGSDHPLGPFLREIFDAHRQRVAGLSSPAEADATVSKVIASASAKSEAA